MASNSMSEETWVPSCSVHVPKEFIPEAKEFEDNLEKYGIVKSELFEARMASYEAEWGPSKENTIEKKLISEGPKPFFYSTVLKRMNDRGDASYLDPYDDDFYPLHQPLSKLVDEDEEDLISTIPSPFNFNVNESDSCVQSDSRTGISCVLDGMTVAPDNQTPKAKRVRKKKKRKKSSKKEECKRDQVPAKKKSSKKSKPSIEIQRN